MLRIVTDGAADFPPGWQEQYDVDVIPINIQFGDKTYLQNIDLDNDGFYKMVEDTGRIPKTSQPSPFQFSEFYKKIARAGDTILSVHVTSKLSGTYNSAVAAAKELVGKFKVLPVDSKCGSMGMAFMCREAREMERSGKTIDQIIAHLESVRQQVRIILTLDKLDFARMSGRINALSAVIASLLNIKPIATLKDGMLKVVEKVRTRNAALSRVMDMVEEEFGGKPLNMGILHARDVPAGQALLEQAKTRFNVKDIFLSELTISLAANLGPGTVGLVLYPAG